jgi:hypothetical protein
LPRGYQQLSITVICFPEDEVKANARIMAQPVRIYPPWSAYLQDLTIYMQIRLYQNLLSLSVSGEAKNPVPGQQDERTETKRQKGGQQRSGSQQAYCMASQRHLRNYLPSGSYKINGVSTHGRLKIFRPKIQLSAFGIEFVSLTNLPEIGCPLHYKVQSTINHGYSYQRKS